MSIWTHVAAIIRIDSVIGFGLGPQCKEDVERIVGPMAHYGCEKEERDACKLPIGSEGSLKYDIWQNSQSNSVAQFTLSVFGDLRDYDETDSIKEWFDSLCGQFPIIRQGVCLAEVEYREPVVFIYKKEEA